jgi:hypothetical protein
MRTGVIPINSHRRAASKPELPPQTDPPSANSANKWKKRSFIRMFALGNGIWKISRWHGVTPSAVEAVLRDRLIESGAAEEAFIPVRKAA